MNDSVETVVVNEADEKNMKDNRVLYYLTKSNSESVEPEVMIVYCSGKNRYTKVWYPLSKIDLNKIDVNISPRRTKVVTLPAYRSKRYDTIKSIFDAMMTEGWKLLKEIGKDLYSVA